MTMVYFEYEYCAKDTSNPKHLAPKERLLPLHRIIDIRPAKGKPVSVTHQMPNQLLWQTKATAGQQTISYARPCRNLQHGCLAQSY